MSECFEQGESIFFEIIEKNIGRDFMFRGNDGVPTNGVYIRQHIHFEHEIMWFTKAEGEFRIGDKLFELSEHTLLYVSPMTPHDMRLNFTKDHERYLLQFDNAMMNRLKIKLPFNMDQSGFVIHPSDSDSEKLQLIFKWIAEIGERNDYDEIEDVLLVLFLKTALSLIGKEEESVILAERELSYDCIINFLMEIEKTKKFNLSLSAAADLCGLPMAQFSKLIKKPLTSISKSIV